MEVVIPIPKCETNLKFNVAFVVMHLEEKIWIGAFSVNQFEHFLLLKTNCEIEIFF